MKKVVIISSTYRTNGNSNILAQEFEKGAKESGNDVEFISLKDLKIDFCKGCLACQNNKKKGCIINDDMKKVIGKVKQANVLVFATPIYFYAISGQLKTFLDRLNPLYVQDYNFKEVYLLTTCADSNLSAMNCAMQEINGFVSCFDGVIFKKALCGTNVTNPKEISEHNDILLKSYELGKSI